MDPLGDLLTTRPIQMGWEFTMEAYPSRQFGFIDDPDRQFGNGAVWTRTRTWSDGPEPLLTLCCWEKEQQEGKCGSLVSRFKKAVTDNYQKIKGVTNGNVNECIVNELKHFAKERKNWYD